MEQAESEGPRRPNLKASGKGAIYCLRLHPSEPEESQGLIIPFRGVTQAGVLEGCGLGTTPRGLPVDCTGMASKATESLQMPHPHPLWPYEVEFCHRPL